MGLRWVFFASDMQCHPRLWAAKVAMLLSVAKQVLQRLLLLLVTCQPESWMQPAELCQRTQEAVSCLRDLVGLKTAELLCCLRGQQAIHMLPLQTG